MAFADILRQISEEADRTQLESMASKYPSLKRFAEMGEKVESLRPRLKALDDSYEDDVTLPLTELERWRTWKQNDWPVHQREKETLQTALATAQARVSELENRSDTDMTPDEVKEVVKATLKEAGVVTTPELEAQMTKLVNDKVSPVLESKVNGLTQRFEDVYAALTPKLREHERNFGEDLDPKAVFDYMKKSGQMDPIKAYNEMVAPKLQDKTNKEWEEKVAAAHAAGVADGKREAVGASGRANPVDGKGSSAPQGALLRRHAAKMAAQAEQKGPVRLGQMRLAAEEVQERRERQASGTAA